MGAFAGIRRVLRIGVLRRELDDELAFHFERTVEELMEQGRTREQAEAEARRRFGDEREYRREIERIDRGAAARVRWRERGEVVLHSLRLAARRMAHAPGFTLGVVLTFGLGIGANAVMFGVIDRILLQPPPHVVDADEVRRLFLDRFQPRLGEREFGQSMSHPDFLDFTRAETLESVAAYAGRTLTIGSGMGARQHAAALVTGQYFPLLGVRPAIGRFFGPDDDRAGAPGVAVISYALWQGEYGGDREIIGQTLDFGYGPYEIIGVAPQGFTGVDLRANEMWLPLEVAARHIQGTNWVDNRNWWWLRVISRVREGVEFETVAAELTTLHRQGRSEHIAEDNYDPTVRIVPASLIIARGPEAPEEAAVARWLMGISALVLLIACANVANLLLARAVRQRREIGIRLALGSSRTRVLGQVMVESVLLALLGGVAALAFTHWGAQLLRAVLLPDVAWGATVTARVAIFVVVLTALAGLVAGLIPAVQASRPDVAETLKSGSRSASGASGRTRSALTVVQAALSVVLLVGAGLFVRSLQRVNAIDMGFDPDGVLLVQSIFDREVPEERQAEYLRRAVERLPQVPGVVAASGDRSIPFWSIMAIDLRAPDLDSIPTLSTGSPALHEVDPGYFRVMDLRVLRGRPITEADTEGAPRVVVINETMARVLWPGQEALGKCLIIGGGGRARRGAAAPAEPAPEPPCATVVGIVENTHSFEVVEDESMHYYVARSQKVAGQGRVDGLLIRVSGDPEAMATTIRRALLELEPGLRYAEIQPLRELMDPQFRSWELGAAMFAAFGLLALVVAGIGLYSVLAFSVAQRTFELGVRAALGATRERLMRLVFGQAVRLVAVGIAIGLVIVLVTGPRLEPMLFETSPRDPLTLALVAAVLLGVAVLAGTLPALRATRVSPSEALRAE